MSTGARRLDAAVARGRPIAMTIDGRAVTAYEGETVAAVLLLEGRRDVRATGRRGEPRGLFCGMGVCFDCLATVDGVANVRTCVTFAAHGMVVSTGTADDDARHP